MRALVVEDESDVRELLAWILSQLGFGVVTVADGQEGLEELEDGSTFDVALVD